MNGGGTMKWMIRDKGVAHKTDDNMISVKRYIECECPNCGYITGNQGLLFNYCPMCGESVKEYCGTCQWHDEFSGVCCNADSEHCSDAMPSDSSCEYWKRFKGNT